MDERIIIASDGDQVVITVHPGGELHLDRGQLPIVREGQALAEQEVYLDVLNPGHGPFRALPGQMAGSGHGFVAQVSVEPAVWDVLVRADGEARLLREVEADEVVIVEPVLHQTATPLPQELTSDEQTGWRQVPPENNQQ